MSRFSNLIEHNRPSARVASRSNPIMSFCDKRCIGVDFHSIQTAGPKWNPITFFIPPTYKRKFLVANVTFYSEAQYV